MRRYHTVSTHCAEVVAVVVTAAVGVAAAGEAGVAAENDDSPCQAVFVKIQKALGLFSGDVGSGDDGSGRGVGSSGLKRNKLILMIERVSE